MVADAVRIEKVSDLAPGAEIAVTVDGTDVTDGSGSVNFGSVGAGGSAQKLFTVTNLGSSNLTLSNLAASTGFSIVNNFASTTVAAGASTTFLIGMTTNTVGTFTGTLSFSNNDTDENPFNFSLTGTVTAATILDNSDSGYTSTGFTGYSGGYKNSVQYAASGGTAQATWTFNGLTPGEYGISATWTLHTNRATNAPYSINGTVVTVNQQLAPTGINDQGGVFKSLGSFVITGNQIVVRLNSAGANGYVVADAIRIERLGPLPGIFAPNPLLGTNNEEDSLDAVFESELDWLASPHSR